MLFGTPIDRESMEFELIDCRVGTNGTSSVYILQINKTTLWGQQLIYYEFLETEINDQIEIATDDCSSATPDFYIILCEEKNSTDFFDPSCQSIFSSLDFGQFNLTIESFVINGEEFFSEIIDNSDEDDHRHSTNSSSILDQSSKDDDI